MKISSKVNAFQFTRQNTYGKGGVATKNATPVTTPTQKMYHDDATCEKDSQSCDFFASDW